MRIEAEATENTSLMIQRLVLELKELRVSLGVSNVEAVVGDKNQDCR